MKITPVTDAVTVITVNGKPFVSGLIWRPLSSPRKSRYMAEAKTYGRENGMDVVAIRRGAVHQAGFAPKPAGRRKDKGLRGMYSLAASLTGILGDDWIGVFDLGDELYAFVAVNQAAIMPGHDFVGPRDEVEDALRETYSVLTGDDQEQHKPQVIAPANWNFGGDERSLEDILQPKDLKNDYRLKPLTLGLTTQQLVTLIVGVSALIAIAGGGLHFWHVHQEHVREARLRAIQAAQKQQAAERAHAEAAAIRRPWQVTPPIKDVLTACTGVWSALRLNIGGWAFDNGRCVVAPNGNRASDFGIGTYHRNDGPTVAAFVKAANALGATPGIFDTGNTGAIRAHLHLAAYTSDTPASDLPPLSAGLQALVTRIQSLPKGVATVTVKEKAEPKPATTTPVEKKAAAAPTWRTDTVQIQSRLMPSILLHDINIPGLRIYQIAVKRSDYKTNWNIEGELYGR